jgi:hypothetical protein
MFACVTRPLSRSPLAARRSQEERVALVLEPRSSASG